MKNYDTYIYIYKIEIARDRQKAKIRIDMSWFPLGL